MKKALLGLGLTILVGCHSLDDVVIDYVKDSKQEIAAIESTLEGLPGSYIPKYDTIVHRALDMEKEFGAVSKDYLYPDLILYEAEMRFGRNNRYDIVDAIGILKSIDNMLVHYKVEPKRGLSEKVLREQDLNYK